MTQMPTRPSRKRVWQGEEEKETSADDGSDGHHRPSADRDGAAHKHAKRDHDSATPSPTESIDSTLSTASTASPLSSPLSSTQPSFPLPNPFDLPGAPPRLRGSSRKRRLSPHSSSFSSFSFDSPPSSKRFLPSPSYDTPTGPPSPPPSPISDSNRLLRELHAERLKRKLLSPPSHRPHPSPPPPRHWSAGSAPAGHSSWPVSLPLFTVTSPSMFAGESSWASEAEEKRSRPTQPPPQQPLAAASDHPMQQEDERRPIERSWSNDVMDGT